jgi:hypothetical protein
MPGLGQQTDVATGLRVSAILLKVNIAPNRYGTRPSQLCDGGWP